MFAQGNQISELSDPRASDDGKAIGFKVIRTDGAAFEIWCELSQLNDVFYFLAAAAAYAAGLGVPEDQSEKLARNPLTPIPAEGLGFVAGRAPGETALMIRLSGFDMAFAIPNSGLVRLSDDIARIARTLSADPQKRN